MLLVRYSDHFKKSNMKFLGIDYGDRRIGIAVSDEGGVFAFPRVVLLNTETLFDEIKKICADEKIEKIIIGIPISFSGDQSAQARKVIEFIKSLQQRITMPIEKENEIFSTKAALDAGSNKEKIDQSAAALILQSYLDRTKKQEDKKI